MQDDDEGLGQCLDALSADINDQETEKMVKDGLFMRSLAYNLSRYVRSKLDDRYESELSLIGEPPEDAEARRR